MAYQPISGIETQPGAIVSSSLLTRLNQNVELCYEILTKRSAGDLVLWTESIEVASSGGDIAKLTKITLHSGFNGEFRFKANLHPNTTLTISRNDTDIESNLSGAVSIDVGDWAVGDRIGLEIKSMVTNITKTDVAVCANLPAIGVIK